MTATCKRSRQASRKSVPVHQILMLTINVYDYPVDLMVCYRLQPVLKPKSFRHRVRVVAQPETGLTQTLMAGHYANV